MKLADINKLEAKDIDMELIFPNEPASAYGLHRIYTMLDYPENENLISIMRVAYLNGMKAGLLAMNGESNEQPKI